MPPARARVRAAVVDDRRLRAWPLPVLARDCDKEDRGRLLVIAGSAPMPGAAVLVAEAALRAGAGKVQLATERSVVGLVAAAVPEIYAIPLAGGGSADAVLRLARRCDALCIGPGMSEGAPLRALLRRLLTDARLAQVPLLIDAAALIELAALRDAGMRPARPLVVTPHAGELAAMLGWTKAAIIADPRPAALACARRFAAVALLKGGETWIATPVGALHRSSAGGHGLATGGSGDVLAGVITALLARGATPVQAAAWGAHVHGRCGEILARRVGAIGYLARELAAEVPGVMQGLGANRR
ncbi:MAG TPA: NAD(P)H-hydrate dehydratase [Planctomycetota bacterium]|nr:NAD(P)H-hydrate dehydratase [Planctomycetota bacterium]